jgi:hypothetical protein
LYFLQLATTALKLCLQGWKEDVLPIKGYVATELASPQVSANLPLTISYVTVVLSILHLLTLKFVCLIITNSVPQKVSRRIAAETAHRE